jgi:hypothetical protein
MSPCCLAIQHGLRLTAQALMCTAWLAGSTAVLAQPVAPDQGKTSTVLIERQGQQKQRLIQGQAATALSRRQAKDLEQAPPPGVAAAASAASSPKPVTQADVLLQREQRIRRLNAAKVDPKAKP